MHQHLPTFYTTGPLPAIEIGSFSLPTYYLVISLVTCICILWGYRRTMARQLSEKTYLDMCLISLVAGFGGARFLHVVYDMPAYYIEHPIEIFYVWQGGFTYYGGLIAGYLSALVYIRKIEENIWPWHDLAAPILAFGYGAGRLACLLHGCCYGKVCDLPWAMPLQQTDLQSQVSTTLMRHPAPLYAFCWEMLTILLLIYIENYRRLKSGQLFFIWLALHGVGRIIMEIFRDDFRGPQWGYLSLSMAISFLLVAVAIFGFRQRSSSS